MTETPKSPETSGRTVIPVRWASSRIVISPFFFSSFSAILTPS